MSLQFPQTFTFSNNSSRNQPFNVLNSPSVIPTQISLPINQTPSQTLTPSVRRSYKYLLSPFQLGIFDEMMVKRKAGISVPMGSGKTLISLVAALEISGDYATIVVCSKSLLTNWSQEIIKWFGNKIPFIIYHPDYIKNIENYIPDPYVRIIITTPEVTSKFYKSYNIGSKLITIRKENEGKFGQHDVIDYHPITYIDSEYLGVIYGTYWGTCIVDEFQENSNITTLSCQSILSICAENKWALSGTLFSEPKIERILSYYIFIEDETFPNNIPDAKKFIRSPDFKGVDITLVKRTSTPVVLNVTKHIVTVYYRPEEEKIYEIIRDMMIYVAEEKEKYKYNGDTKKQKSFGGFILALLVYLRQTLVSPMTPVNTVIQEFSKYDGKTELTDLLMKKFQEANIYDYVNNPANIVSSRISKAIEIANQHNKVVIFTDFRTNIDIIKNAMSYRKILTIEGSMKSDKREAVINEARNSNEFVLLLTYKIGSSGLNLQVANTVILLDYAWNSSTTNQAIARVARQGQTQPVDVFYMISTTGLEDSIFKKHIDKATVAEELGSGAVESEIETIHMDEIITMLEQEVVMNKMKTLTVEKK